jgi:hypothetical protein
VSVKFYVGLHQPADAKHFDRACVSINRIRHRKGPFAVDRWIMDSGAFTEIATHGCYRHSVSEYATAARRWVGNGSLEAIVAQDYMCEPFILRKTGLTVAEHHRLTIARYDELLAEDVGAPVLPTLQGFDPLDYARHAESYGARLTLGMWVGVGSVCKRNGSPIDVLNVLSTIKTRRPDLRLHGFGLKRSALLHPGVRALLYSADSMAWSFAARKQGRRANDWREAKAFETDILAKVDRPAEPWQMPFIFDEVA